MSYEDACQDIIKGVGGVNNIKTFVHCATRLRFTLGDVNKLNKKEINSITEVMGIAEGSGQIQLIVGADKVNEMSRLIETSINKQPFLDAHENPENNKACRQNEDIPIHKKFSTILMNLLNGFSQILTPLVPALAAAGMLKVVLLMISKIGLLTPTDPTYSVLNLISDSIFYFMPLITAFLSAKYFKTDMVLATVCAGVLIHPTFIKLLSEQSLLFLGIPVAKVNYSGTILPIIVMVWVLSKIEPIADKLSPKIIKIFIKPMIEMLIIVPLTLWLLGPIGNWVGQGLGDLVTIMYDKVGWLAVGILGGLLPFCVLTGLNRALTPLSIQIYTTLGYEPLFRTAYIAGNMTQGAAALAIAFKTKNKRFKQIAFSAAFTTLLSGITEPSLFGVILKAKRSLIAVFLGGVIGGVYTGLTGVKAYAMAVPGFLSLPMFIGDNPYNFINAVIGFIISIIATFVLTLIIGFDDIKEFDSDTQ